MYDLTVGPLNEAFCDKDVDAAELRHFSYISMNIARLEYELDRHKEERRELFEHMKTSQNFRNRIQPVIHSHRRRTRQSGFDPRTNQPIVKKLRRPSTPYRPLPPPPKTSSKGSSQSTRSFLSTGSSSDNPIDVDNLQTVKKPRFDPEISEIKNGRPDPTNNKGHITKTSKLSCERCHQPDHNREECTTKMFKPTCERCRQWGHEKPNCDTKIRSFSHCDICEWLKKPQRLCEHYDLSPVDVKTLRGDKIPYDYSD